MYDMNDAELPRGSDLIPDGSFVKVTMTIRPGGLDGQGEVDRGLLKAAKTPGSDVRMLDCEFTVAAGPHIRRKFWQMFTVAGGKVDEHGVSIGWKISKGTFRAMIDSALGLDPQDMSEAARGKRVLRGLADLSGITFAAKVRVEPASDSRYGDSNRLDRVVLPGEPEYRQIMAGEAVPAQPSTRAARPATPPAAAAPAWAPAASAPMASRSWERPAAATPTQPAPQPGPAPAATGPAWLNG
ncbi:hypothetical protein CR162_16465 [Pseudoroseomonas rhizosphaerae]|uniref:Uncharacterized protein n=1 Tax=Teichococcus rhizosphaerae TaxID=1335062 RepID=A0A2C6XZC1_9PROT|nr:hypothetical protein [Pseudoroseomonas rhizosphaerae]PHK93862.1 hypothetical protein CR162_16465 [Pseudoroseomonas rhizosphaerae]